LGHLVSIVIPAHNASASLGECLAALQADLPEWAEIVVVDDASGDDTAEVAARLGARVLKLDRNAGPSAARNHGVAHSDSEIVLFVDSDVVARPGVVRRVADFFEKNPGISAVFGSYDDSPRVRGLVSQYRNLLHHFVHQNGRSEAATFWGALGGIRRAAFEEVSGFDCGDYPRCIEDIELGYRLREAGHRIHLDKGLLCTHLKRWTLSSMVKTDIFCRAIPWARLNSTRSGAPDDLNIRADQKISVALVGLALVFLVLAWLNPWLLLASGLSILTVVAINRDLFLYLLRKRGFFFALGCLPLHLLYFFYSGLSYLYTRVWSGLGLPVGDGNS